MGTFTLVGSHNRASDRVHTGPNAYGIVTIRCTLTVTGCNAPCVSHHGMRSLKNPLSLEATLYELEFAHDRDACTFLYRLAYQDVSGNSESDLQEVMRVSMHDLANMLMASWSLMGHDVDRPQGELYTLTIE